MQRSYVFTASQAVALCLFLFSSLVVGQSPVLVTNTVSPVNQLSLGDLDFLNSATPKWLFTINMTTVPPGRTVTAMMTIHMDIILASGEEYADAVVISTKPPHFIIPGSRTITNLDLGRTIPVNRAQIRDDAKRRLEETALPGGSVPAGQYRFMVDISVGDTTVGTAFEIVISNPTTLELLSPIDGDQFATQFPLFQWVYDGPSARISIYEKLPSQGTLEEAASGIPHFSTTTTSNSLQYPPAGARLLEPSKTYVWYVEGLSGVSGGTMVGRKSALRSFTVGSTGAPSLSSILDDLARAMPQYQSLFDELKSQGFTTAGTLQLNGTSISVSDLLRLLNKLQSNPEAVTSVVLE